MIGNSLIGYILEERSYRPEKDRRIRRWKVTTRNLGLHARSTEHDSQEEDDGSKIGKANVHTSVESALRKCTSEIDVDNIANPFIFRSLAVNDATRVPEHPSTLLSIRKCHGR
jgi:hypothetical protein